MKGATLLPPKQKRGPAFALLAVLLFVMTMTAAAGLGLFNASRLLIDASEQRELVQLPSGMDQSEALEAFLEARPEVVGAEATSRAELEETLEDWLGNAVEDARLPLPAIVNVELAEGADREALRGALRERYPDAHLTSQRALMGPVLDAVRTVSLVGLALVVAIAAAAAVAVLLTTRAALAANRTGIAILHGMGATDRQVAASFEGRIAREALAGGLLGTLLALLCLFLLASTLGEGLRFLMGGAGLLGPLDALLLLLLPLIGAVMAFAVARWVILRDLRRQP